MVGLWSYNGPAILNAVKDANKVGQVKIICFDEEDETLAGVKDGRFSRPSCSSLLSSVISRSS
jgi:ABC-type sugar transport system substrate-binding protein